MAIKYFIQYTDTQNIDYTIKIKSDSWDSFPITVNGYAIIDRPEIEEIYTVIRGSSITLKLEADSDLTFEDLYSENEKEYSVELYRGLDPIFIGYIDPSGLFEDLVNDRWELSLRCVDGLGLLDNLSYVDDDGLAFIGKENDLNVIYNCLHRTGLYQENGDELFIESSINTMYVFAEDDLGAMPNVYSNQERFYKDDGETIMSCLEVLESTLRKYGGAITQENGKWKIFSFYELLAGDRNFYTYKGKVYTGTSVKDYPEQTIGSQINDDVIHWCNDNLRKEIVPSVGAVKVNYKYGFVKSLISNTEFRHDNTIIYNWTILNSTDLSLGADNKGVIIESKSGDPDLMLQAPAFDLIIGTKLKIVYNVDATLLPSTIADRIPIDIVLKTKVSITDGTDTYYLNSDLEWTTTDSINLVRVRNIVRGGFTIPEIELPPSPITGSVTFVIARPATVKFTPFESSFVTDVFFNKMDVFFSADENIQGANHTYQVEGTSTRVEDVIEISVGDNEADVYLGALYKQDQDTNTDIWQTVYTPVDIVGNQPILQILAEYIALHKRQPLYKITGDAYGYFEYLQIFVFPLIPDRKFMITGYNFNTKTNIGSYTFVELKRGSTFGLTYNYALDYGNTVKPTIVG